jgi:hypothetical protein
VTIGDNNFIIPILDVGTVQGFIIGPIMFAIFVLSLFDLAVKTKFADENYMELWNSQLSELIINMNKSLECIMKWLKDSGLKVDDTKTKFCLFNICNHPAIELSINGLPSKANPSCTNFEFIFFENAMDLHSKMQ